MSKVTERAQNADFRRKTTDSPFLLEILALAQETAENRRSSLGSEASCRKSQETADWALSP